MFSTLSKREISILAYLNSLAANALNLVGPQIWSFGKELKGFFFKASKTLDCVVKFERRICWKLVFLCFLFSHQVFGKRFFLGVLKTGSCLTRRIKAAGNCTRGPTATLFTILVFYGHYALVYITLCLPKNIFLILIDL